MLEVKKVLACGVVPENVQCQPANETGYWYR